MQPLKIVGAARSVPQKDKLCNEDNYYLNGFYPTSAQLNTAVTAQLNRVKEINLYAVFDGVGGSSLGDHASSEAVDMLMRYHEMLLHDITPDWDNTMNAYFGATNEKLCEHMMESGEGTREGTTAAVLAVHNNSAYIYNIGDSRIYKYDGDRMSQLSYDHTYVQQLINMGYITKDQALAHPKRNKLSQYLGIFPEELEILPHIGEPVPLDGGEVFLICSDGITDFLADSRLSQILDGGGEARAMVDKIIEEATAAGATDDITAMVVKIERGESEKFIHSKGGKILLRVLASLMVLITLFTAGLIWWLSSVNNDSPANAGITSAAETARIDYFNTI